MTDSSVSILVPTDKERGYNKGWVAYHDGRELNSNPFHPEDEVELYEGFEDGWSWAQGADIDD